MRIAQVAPLAESVPPKLYGGTERVVSYLTDELVALGNDVTLFASGDSVTDAILDPACPRALRLNPDSRDQIAPLILMIERLARRAAEFDIIHFHFDCLHLPLFSRLGAPFLTTLHGRLDGHETATVHRQFSRAPVVSISDAQRAPLPDRQWLATVHHGLPANLLRPRPTPKGDYLAFLGRMSPEKQPEGAIRLARMAGWPIRLAAKVDEADRGYFNAVIRPLLKLPGVEFIGEIGEHEKAEFLGDAAALLFPINWPEPFGMVMIEAMACGTPVIAFGCGSVPEVIEDGVSGFVVDGPAAALAAIDRLPLLRRERVRRAFEERFTSRLMAENYLRLYSQLAQRAGADGERPRVTEEPGSSAHNVVALHPTTRRGVAIHPRPHELGLFLVSQGAEMAAATGVVDKTGSAEMHGRTSLPILGAGFTDWP
jgi:glycosyltransferase involved in cell wall biosynthesis